MLEQFTDSAQQAVKLAKQAAASCHHSYIGSEHLLLGLMREPKGTAGAVLREFQVDEKKVQDLISQLISPESEVLTADREGYTPRAEGILRSAIEEAHQFGSEKAGTEHILVAMLKDLECVGTRLLHTMGVNLQKLYSRIMDIMGVTDKRYRSLKRNAHSARESASERTPFLDQYSRDLTEQAREGRTDPVVGRQTEIDRIMQILSRRTKNNPCLIGEPGVGKTAIVEGLANRIVAEDVPEPLQGRRVVSLDMASMVAGSKYRGEFEERMKRVLEEVMDSQEVLLFIDELHTIIGAGGAEGSLDASNIMKPFLSRGEIQVIGATTVEEYRKYVEKDPALERRFQPIMVEEPSVAETQEILRGLRGIYEQHHGVTISDSAIDAAAKLSARYINDRFLPDKAIDLLDEACAKRQLGSYRMPQKVLDLEEEYAATSAQMEEQIKSGDYAGASKTHEVLQELQKKCERQRSQAQKRIQSDSMEVTEEDIAEVVSAWTKIPVQKVAEQEGKRLLNLEKDLHKRVIGQDEAVTAVAKAIKRGRAGLKDPRRPIGSFLFLGPTGVGKTELSKALADTVFGSEQSLIRVDMSEYMESHSVSKLVGSPPGYVGYEEGGQLSEKVRRHPYSVILFDEIEKAHPDVFNILLQVLDEGHITDSQGRKVDFKNTIMIMTSNAGAQSIISPKRLGFGAAADEQKNYEAMKSSVMEEVRRLFKPEFLNRIDDIIVFHSLNEEHIRSIVTLLFKELQNRCLEQMNIRLNVRPAVRDYIAKSGFDEKYGARPLRRAIQNKVEDALSEELLSGAVKSGDEVTVTLVKEKIVFRVSHPEDNKDGAEKAKEAEESLPDADETGSDAKAKDKTGGETKREA